jgi:polyisoprenoid-binding protein YceI
MADKLWVNDPMHSEMQFKVKHLMITTVTGYFREFHVNVTTQGDDFTNAVIDFEANTASVDTNNSQRDEHLRSGDFFESQKYPQMKFRSSSMTRKSDNNYELNGNLTIRDVTKPITLNVEFGGMMKDPYGNQKAGFSLSGVINRKEWNLNWNTALESGGWLVADDVKLYGEIQLVEKN